MVLAIAPLFLALPPSVLAHDIPNDVTVQAFLKPSGDRLQFLARVPLRAMRDIDFPTRGAQGYLDLDRVQPLLSDAATLWISDFVKIYEDDRQLPKAQVVAARISLPSDKSFASFDEALAHVKQRPLSDADVFWNQVMLDVLFEYPIQSEHSHFSIAPGGLGRLGLRVVTALRFSMPDGSIRAFEFEGDPGLVRMDPAWYQAALRFVDL